MVTEKSGKLQRFLAQQALKGLDTLEHHFNPLKTKLQNDPYYRFQSIAEVKDAAKLGTLIDANRATTDDWLRLPGLSIHQARTLAQLTASGLCFNCIDDIAAALEMPVQRLLPLNPILQFRYYDPASAVLIQTVNVNQATVEQLVKIPAIDHNLARVLVYDRQRYGPYHNWVDFKQRLRLSPKVLTALLHYLKF